MDKSYAHPDVLVSTEWMATHGMDDAVRVVEVDVDTWAYDEGHVPGAIAWNWTQQLCDTVRRDVIPRDRFENLMRESGVSNNTIVVLYGDNNNWFAAWAFWQLKIYGHRDVRLMDGGRKKWIAEGRPLAVGSPEIQPTHYQAKEPDFSIRAYLSDVQAVLESGSSALIDVRSGKEYAGEILAPPGLPETCQRGGHIPGAESVPWGLACNDDGTFRDRQELEQIYRNAGIGGDKPVVTYCRIGERSSHTWFVLKYLLGLSDVKNYDGSWTEWGNLVGAAVKTGEAA